MNQGQMSLLSLPTDSVFREERNAVTVLQDIYDAARAFQPHIYVNIQPALMEQLQQCLMVDTDFFRQYELFFCNLFQRDRASAG